jgi:O-antigen ligase
MELIFVALQTSVPYFALILVSVMSIAFIGISLSKPRILIYPYLALLFFVSANNYGRVDNFSTSIYSRGSGVLYFSAVLWYLLICFTLVRFTTAFNRNNPVLCSLNKWFLGFFFLFIGHICVGLMLDIPLEEITSVSGISNIIWMGLLIAVIQLCFQGKSEEINELLKFFIIAGLTRAIFGLIRWAIFGGDPANAYANRHGLDLKLTFFDVNDSLVCWLACSIAIVNLLHPGAPDYSRSWRYVLWATVATTTVCIILSFRRTAWIGFLLAGAFLLLQLPKQRRWQVVLLAGPVILCGIFYTSVMRLSQTKGASGANAFFYDIQSNRLGGDGPRLLELKFALLDFLENPIFGIGSWGRYKGHELISWQTGEYGGTFVHSGVLHIALKSGLVGVFMFTAIMVTFVLFWKNNKSSFNGVSLALATSGVSGAIFMFPDLLIGTPIPQIRTMQMIGLCLSLPYLANNRSSSRQSIKMKTNPLMRFQTATYEEEHK